MSTNNRANAKSGPLVIQICSKAIFVEFPWLRFIRCFAIRPDSQQDITFIKICFIIGSRRFHICARSNSQGSIQHLKSKNESINCVHSSRRISQSDASEELVWRPVERQAQETRKCQRFARWTERISGARPLKFTLALPFIPIQGAEDTFRDVWFFSEYSAAKVHKASEFTVSASDCELQCKNLWAEKATFTGAMGCDKISSKMRRKIQAYSLFQVKIFIEKCENSPSVAAVGRYRPGGKWSNWFRSVIEVLRILQPAPLPASQCEFEDLKLV